MSFYVPFKFVSCDYLTILTKITQKWLNLEPNFLGKNKITWGYPQKVSLIVLLCPLVSLIVPSNRLYAFIPSLHFKSLLDYIYHNV